MRKETEDNKDSALGSIDKKMILKGSDKNDTI